MSEFTVDLGAEITRKAFNALSEVIEKVNEGAFTAEQGRWMLGTMQTAFNGVTDDQDFHHLLQEAEKSFQAMPKFDLIHRCVLHNESDERVVLTLHNNKLVIKLPSGDKVKDFELFSDAYLSMIKYTNAFKEKGFVE